MTPSTPQTVSVAFLWTHNKDYCWGLGDSDTDVTLEELWVDIEHPGYLDRLAEQAREEMDFNFLVDLRKHRQAVLYYIDMFRAGKAAELAIELSGANGSQIDDGNHRLVAAKYLGLKKIPVKVWKNRP